MVEMARGQRKTIEEKINAKRELIDALMVRVEAEKKELASLYAEKKKKEMEAVSELISDTGLQPEEVAEALQQTAVENSTAVLVKSMLQTTAQTAGSGQEFVHNVDNALYLYRDYVDIYRYRKDFIDNINKYLGDIFIYISGTSGLKLFYDTQIDVSVDNNIKVNLFEKIKSNYDREIIYGTSLIGPHRDDFSFKADNIDLLLYGSQGQQKMAVLALKLAEIDVFMDICSEYPVLLLDDLFSELDVDKRNKVISYLNRDIQTIVTTTEIDNINDEIINEAYVFKINNGEVMTDNYKTIEKGT